MKNKKLFISICAFLCLFYDSAFGFSDEYYKCLGDGPVAKKDMLRCLKEDQIMLKRSIDENINRLSANSYFRNIPANESLHAYLAHWDKYSDSLCKYFSFAFDYVDNEKITSPEDSLYQYEYCRWVELSALERRLDKIKEIIAKKDELQKLDASL